VESPVGDDVINALKARGHDVTIGKSYSIVDSLVRLHGGTFHIDSAVGAGTTVTTAAAKNDPRGGVITLSEVAGEATGCYVTRWSAYFAPALNERRCQQDCRLSPSSWANRKSGCVPRSTRSD